MASWLPDCSFREKGGVCAQGLNAHAHAQRWRGAQMSRPLCEDQDGTTGFLFPKRACLLCLLSPLCPLESRRGSPCRGFSPFCLPCPLFCSCPAVSVSLPRPQGPYGILYDSQGRWPSYPTPGPACVCPARAFSCWGGFSVTSPPPPHPTPRSPSGLGWSPGNHTGSHRALAKHSVFVLCSRSL